MTKKIFIFYVFFMFIFIFLNVSKADTLKEGIYQIKSAIDSEFVLDITGISQVNCANVELWRNNGGDNQKFEIKKDNQGYYTIKCMHSNKYFDVAYASKKVGTNLEQFIFNDGDNQKWDIISNEDGTYSFKSKCNDLYIDIENNKMKCGTNILMWVNNGGKNQKFFLEEIINDSQEELKEGIYKICSAIDDSYVLDITGASRDNCANLELWIDNGGNNQKFAIKKIDDKYYTITNVNSEKSIDVVRALKENGTNVEQFKHNNGDNQKWIIKNVKNDLYTIISKCNNLNINVDGYNCKNGININMWEKNNQSSQLFKFVETSINRSDEDGKSKDFKLNHPEIKVGIDVSKYQENIDWKAVKNDGIDYVMVRAGFRGYGESGTLNVDTYLEKNVLGAKKEGLDVGVYFFSQAKNREEGIQEAKYTLDLIKKYNITYPIAFDTEYSSSPTLNGRADNISVQDRTDATKGFCETIKNAGYKVLIYSSPYWIKEKLDISQLLEYKLWLANYTGATQKDPLKKPSSYKGNYVMWQYTDRGYVNGINGGVDCNIYFYLKDEI